MDRRLLFFGFLLALGLARADTGSVLRSIGEINSIPYSAITNKLPIDISGQVLTIHPNNQNSIVTVTDGQSALSFANISKTSCRCGNLVHFSGFINRSPAFGDVGIFAEELEITGDKPMPETNDSFADKTAPSPFGQIQGVIAHVVRDEIDANYNWIVLRTPYGELYASATEFEYPKQMLAKLVDAEVLLRGTVSRGLNLRKPDGLCLSLFGIDGLRVVVPAPDDPFSAPHLGDKTPIHRQSLSGTIIAIGRSDLLIRTDDGKLLQASGPREDLRPGLRVTAAGFATNDQYSRRFTETLFRPETGDARPFETPTDVSESNLFVDRFGHPGINASLHGKTIRVKGILANAPADIHLTEVLRLEMKSHSIFIDTTPLSRKTLDSLESGMTLEVSGVCLAEFNTSNIGSTIPSFLRFLVVPRSPDDLVIIARPPWWTPLKLLLVILLLTFVIVAVLGWNRSLRILSERRGHALSLAITARVRAESRTQERTRLALELHDSISQSLTGVALQIDAAATSMPIAPERRNAYLTTAKNLLASCRKSLQDCLWDLRSRTFEEKNLTEAISRTLAPFLNKCTILVRFNVPREMLSESVMHAVLNIVRELTANAIRHGRASNVRIAGEFKHGCVRFSVTDNGVGFETAHAPGPHDGHFGLQGIHERVNDFDGTVDLSSAPGRGTKAVVTLTVKATHGNNEKENAQ